MCTESVGSPFIPTALFLFPCSFYPYSPTACRKPSSLVFLFSLSFKADLQTSSQRLNLSASNAAVAELKPDCCIDDVIHHEVKGNWNTHVRINFTTSQRLLLIESLYVKFFALFPLIIKPEKLLQKEFYVPCLHILKQTLNKIFIV